MNIEYYKSDLTDEEKAEEFIRLKLRIVEEDVIACDNLWCEHCPLDNPIGSSCSRHPAFSILKQKYPELFI